MGRFYSRYLVRLVGNKSFAKIRIHSCPMKFILTTIAILVFLTVNAQTNPDALKRRKLVENSLSPEIIYGDTLPRLNLEKQMAATTLKE
jgi:hypothetical protein